ncbi:MAG TPA: cytochrome P450, partial [Jatrophihabitans sp.]|nr:cytochrome P450 [Jatrophihabitans sp.]
FWPNPERFDPERFLRGGDERPRHAFLPFGGGRRICIGAGFAQLEAVLVLATIAQSYVLDLVAGADLRPKAGVTLHPRGAVPMVATSR